MWQGLIALAPAARRCLHTAWGAWAAAHEDGRRARERAEEAAHRHRRQAGRAALWGWRQVCLGRPAIGIGTKWDWTIVTRDRCLDA